jgi:hypothetical protein
MKNLPIGISTLSKILENNMVYVDKTDFVFRLTQNAGAYFLSRPRRFGKSLLVDTLKSLFEGRQELFQGLYIHDKWDWTRRHPVIKVDFAGGTVRTCAELELRLGEKFAAIERAYDIKLSAISVAGKFTEIIQLLNEKFGTKAVVLIDEYDKPLLDNIEKPEVQDEIREGLRDFYSVIKEQDANVQFVFLTGVSKFSKVSIFSGINNLKDISLSPEYADCCGYTEADLDMNFSAHLQGVDRALLKMWYNGYNFLGESVYNPFDILLFLSDKGIYKSYWFETGTPSFLMKLFKAQQYFLPDLENLIVGEEILSSFDINKLEITTLLFQTGYLTIKERITKWGPQSYKLGFPNYEVKTAFTSYLISAYTDLTELKFQQQNTLYDCLQSGDIPALEGFIKRLFAGIAYRNFTNNPISQFEGYYASVLYAFFASLDCMVIPEDINNQGQADLTVMLGNKIYVMEIKVVDKAPDSSENKALAQIVLQNYAAKYRADPERQVFELGLVFGKSEKTMVQFGWR